MTAFCKGSESFARRLLTSTALVAAASVGTMIASPAFAQNECGATVEGTVTCPASGNPYPNGITYYTPPVDPLQDPGLDPTVAVYDLTVNLGDGVAIASGANPGVAIIGFNDGAATLNSFGNTTITVAGTGATGVIGNTSTGDLTINTDSIFVDGDASQGINAVSDSGAITIDAASIAATGDYTTGISANSYTGDVSITAGDISATGYYATGITATAVNGALTIDAGSVTTDGDYADGVLALSFGAGTTVDVTVDTISTNGFGADGAIVQGDDANLTVGDITTTGDQAFGAVVYGTGADAGATLTATGLISTSGNDATGVFVKGYYGGDATVTVNDVSTTGDASPAVYANGYSATVTVNGDVSTTGADSQGVYAIAVGDQATVTNAGTITTTGEYSTAVRVISLGYADVINDGTISTAGTASTGVDVFGLYDVSVTGTGSIATSGDGASGIEAYSYGGGVTISQASVTTTGDFATAIDTESGGGDTLIDVGTITTSGTSSDGINAVAPYGGAIDITHGAITTSGDGAFGVYAKGLDDISVTGTSVTTTGYNAAGVYAVSIYGDVAIDEGTISTAGRYSPGIVGASYFGNVSITADDVTTTGDDSKGVYGIAVLAGNTDITVGNVTTSGQYSIGVDAQAYGDASVTVTGTVATSGYAATGVSVYAGGAGTVTNNGTIRTSGDEANGIDVQTIYGDVVIAGTGNVATTGDFSTGIFARTYYGTIDITAGTVTTGRAAGIDAYASQGVSVTAGTVRTTGDDANAINAGGFYSVDVTVGTISTTGASADGISAVSFGGDLDINAGSVLVSGAGSTAIRAFGFGGGTDIAVTGAVRSTQATAINMIAAGAGGAGGPAVGDPALDGIARLTVSATGSVIGGTNAVTSNALNATQITNNGSIAGGTGYAIQAIGGAATIVNNGKLNGRLLLTDNADRLTNTGTFTLIGSSDFGAGADTLINSGTVRLAGAATTQAVTLASLETFTNSGLVDLRNGRAGDTLTIGGYSGSGAATLGLDLTFGTTTATVDRLNLTTATGSTQVVLNPLNGPAILIPATTIVQASAASSATAFTIDGGSQFNGLIQYGVIYNPTALAYQLVSAPNATVYRQAKLGEGLASVWNRSGDAITAHLAAGRDAGWGSPTTDASGRLWLQMFGEVNKRDERRNFAFNGLVQNNVDTGYRQDAFGGQIGFDVAGGASDTGGFTVGVSGGYLSSTMNFAGNDRFEIDAVNGSVYAAFQAGGFFLNGLAKYDYAWISTRGNAPQVNFNLDTKANTWGGKLEAGFRAGSDSFFFEPAASIAYTRTDLDGYGTLGGSFDFDNYTGLRGKAGARIGGTSSLGTSSKLVFYVGGAAVHEFKGENRVDFTSGAQTISIANDRLGTYGQGTIGLNIVTASGVTGFIEGHGEYGDSYKGGGGRAGIRIKF
ncbi:autotransporter outer membrane beta-barrel domain-containing protein [Sphingomonas sp. PB4P5]|uniref:autotransporter outer membrane beta-barrel domain-containing protein n=1 Tax=Parasphingomonas puruogangriensis TaxID=3096155 RepID=UPI002FCAD84F